MTGIKMKARDWKRFYKQERDALGDTAIERLIESAPSLPLSVRASFIFPHTRLRASGHTTAAAARSVVESGAERVLALGVLHGGRARDESLVARARAGEADAMSTVRRIHGPEVIDDPGFWVEEFSLDNFKHLLALTARMHGMRAPEIIERYPFLTATDPLSMPGFGELVSLRGEGVPIIATADLIHHGIGYNTAPEETLDERQTQTIAMARVWIEEGVEALHRKDYDAFHANAAKVKSDFRHSGPVFRELIPDAANFRTAQIQLVDYSDVLETDRPTWVAAALLTVS